FDGDGAPDIAVTNTGSNTVSLLRSNPAARGAFLAATSFVTGNSPGNCAFADVNGDGALDLLVTNLGLTGGATTVSIFLQDPFQRGALLAPQALVSGNGPHGVAVADLDRDGAADLVVSNDLEHTVSVFRQDRAHPGTFLAPVKAPTPTGPMPPLAGDFDHDGLVDVAIPHSATGDFHVFLDDAANPGRLVTPTAYAVGTGARAIVAGDLDGDGLADAVVANLESTFVSVLLQDAAHPGKFLAAASYGSAKSASVAVGDMNGDGRPDIVSADRVASTISVFLQDAAHPGRFLAPSAYPCGGAPIRIALADLDGDGRLDVMTAQSYSEDETVRLGTGGGALGPPIGLAIDGFENSLALADVDGDGAPDAVTARGSFDISAGKPPGFGFRRGHGDGGFDDEAVVGSSDALAAAIVADVDGDGRPDLVGASNGFRAGGGVTLRLGIGGGRFGGELRLTVGRRAHAAAVADVDGDGRLDIVALDESANAISALARRGGRGAPAGRGDGIGAGIAFAEARTLLSTTARALAIADLTGDGVADVIAAG
ncbi:MAG TPA: VCBS repeat-containing protein, partial [Planctomycetota bacterium]|nr:VCBS repeat-containing protein [Planctomycetota bacterium]